MQDNNDVTATPVVDVPQENTQIETPVDTQVATPVDTQESVQEAPLQEQVTETTEVEQVPETTEQVAEEIEETVPEYDITQYMQQPSTPDFQQDENGYIDPTQFYNKVLQDAENRIEQKMKFQQAEAKLWASIETKYPEVKEDSELRDILNAQRIADVASGGKGDLNKIATKLLGKIQSYQTKGKVQAQVSEKVQKSAALESSTSNSTDTNKENDLMNRMSRGDQQARNELIANWLSSGKI
jgi:2-phospho-L-lactate guanylyltransferase (CobY/MobA/RfbA family)